MKLLKLLFQNHVFFFWIPASVAEAAAVIPNGALLYSIKLYIDIAILICCASATKVSFISVLHFLNGAQFLNATFVFALPPVTVIFLVTKIYASG